MDDLLAAFGESIAHGGPMYALVGVLSVIFAVSIWPAIDRRLTNDDEREDRREERKAEESRLREEHDLEMARLQGQWLEQQGRSNAALERSTDVSEALRVQLEVLNASLADSKEHSRAIGDAIGSMASQVNDIHERIVGNGEK